MRISQDNMKLAISVLNLKKEIGAQCHFHHISNPVFEKEMDIFMDKIRTAKYTVTRKLNLLKYKRQNFEYFPKK